MKKILFILVAVTCLVSCSDYYNAESRAERAFYAIDSTECVVEGVLEGLSNPTERRYVQSPKRRAYYEPPTTVMALVTKDDTYYYKWQSANGPLPGPYVPIAGTTVNFGETIRAYGTVRNITNQEGVQFKDILIDSVEVLKSIYSTIVDTVENVVVQGRYSITNLELSDYVYWNHPCLSECKFEDNSDLTNCYINVHVNFQFDTEYYDGSYLCGQHIYYDEWVEAHGTLIQGLDRNDNPYWLINMNSVKKIPTPEGENW